MFPSSGLFADINCPLSKRGFCERPHCSYKHATEVRDVFGVQNGYPSFACGALVGDETRDDCLQELERINKEIETVRHEVEQEQKRLSRCQNIQADDTNAVPDFSACKTAGQRVDRSSCTDFTKTYSQVRKYVVDNSKPRTDLEYDPLSNFSADLRSYSSSGKEQKVKNGNGLKREREAVRCDQKKPAAQAQLSHQSSPEPLDDSYDDSVLIIDIPPSPDNKRGRTQKLSCVTGKSQSAIEELKEVKATPTLIDSPPLCLANAEVFYISKSKKKQKKLQCKLTATIKHLKAGGCINTFKIGVHMNKMTPRKEIMHINERHNRFKDTNCKFLNDLLIQQPAAKSRPQPKILVPLHGPAASGFGSQSSITSRIQQVQQRASILTASVKGGQAFVSSTCQRTPETQTMTCPPTQTPANTQPAHVQSGKLLLKQQPEAAKDKVPHDIRQRYVNMFTEEFLKTTANVNDAFEKAVAEERTVYNRSVNKLKYLSIAVNSLKRLKNQSAASAKVIFLLTAFIISFILRQLLSVFIFFLADDMALYESLRDYILTEGELIESNYPMQHPEKPGSAALFTDNKKGNTDSLKRICCRCGATYSVNQTGKHTRKEECNYHYGKGIENRVPGGVETRYSCCEGVMGAPGCQVFKLHVHDSLSLDGFVSTIPRHPSDTSCPGVYSLDCEMCYTVHGLELSRVTVVNSSLQVVYDTFVRPDNGVIDYNTRFSGISEEDVKGNNTFIREVQETLLSFISADTILIGHSLETDLCALKLLHGTVVDTSVVFPHRLGPPHKLTLNNLTAEYLRRIIQESVCGHDTAEDAAACMELMLWKVKEDGKLKK
uniref:Zgc:152968 n=1 Tax=Lates calcarifer TaxID=8187 RepID=A0A4W6EF35_LATCA